MRNLLKFLTVSAFLFAASPAHAQVSFGIEIGRPPAPRAYRVAPRPGPDYVWVEGYWYAERGQYRWHDGYWTRPPYEGAYWVEPYYDGGRYIGGYWDTPRGRFDHDHRWDRGRERDWNRDRRDDRRDERR